MNVAVQTLLQDSPFMLLTSHEDQLCMFPDGISGNIIMIMPGDVENSATYWKDQTTE